MELKIAILIVLISVTNVFAERTYSQNTKLSLDIDNKTVEQVMNEIETNTEFYFIFNQKQVDINRVVSIQAENKPITDILPELFIGTNVNYAIFDRKILLTTDPVESILLPELSGNNLQQFTVRGTVSDANTREVLPGVNVVVIGTTIGAITDPSGKYVLEVPNSSVRLQFSFIGYTTLEVDLGRQSVLDVALTSNVEQLSEVVVVGYGTQKRTTVTGAVSMVKGTEVANVPVANISGAIAGKMAGVSMRPNGGQPGRDSPDIHIRGIATTGASAPLIVVDGIIRDNINQIDPSSIESVSVLKDAAAVAPYGLGGANGVILITTKKGVVGKPTLTFNSYYGWQAPTYFPRLLDAKDYMRLSNESYLNENPGGTNLPYALDKIANYDALNKENPDLYPNSNTTDLINMVTPTQKYDIQVVGGSEKNKYYVGLGYYGQEGMFDQVNYRRFNYNMNLESKVTNSTTLSIAILGSVERVNDLDVVYTAQQLFRTGYRYKPIVPVYFTNGLWTQTANCSYAAVLNSKGYNKDEGYTTLSTISLEQQLPFIKGLSVKGTFSFDLKFNFMKGWHEPFYYWSQNTNTTPYTYIKSSTGLESDVPYKFLRQIQNQRRYFTYQGFINYQRTFGLHNLTGLIVAEARNNKYEILSAQRNNFAVSIDEMDMGSSAKNDYDNSGTSSTGSQIGYVYRLGYVYNNKYLLETSGRYDGHYYFAPGKRWAYFPAFSIGWRLSEENFMKNVQFINNLKIRGSWGKSGNLAGQPFQYMSGYQLAGNAYAFGSGTIVQRAYQAQESNPVITWEMSTKSDIGFEASFWNSLLIIEADYFTERRSGMLLAPEVTVPLEYGLTLAQENAGEMNNHGIEFAFGSRKEFENGLKLSLDANFSIAKNKMIKIFETSATYDNPNRRRTGRAYGTPFGYHSLGLFSSADDTDGNGIISLSEYPVTQFGALHPGDVKYEDISGPDGVPDGKIDGNDEIAIGYPVYPLMSYGFTTLGEWKGFDLSLFFQGSAMASININNFQTVPFFNSLSNCDYEYFDDHWTSENQNATYPRPTSSPYSNNMQGSDFWMRNTAFLRLKTGSIGYTLPTSVTQFLKIQSVRVYFSGQNILTFYNLKFMDPEMGYTNRETAYPNMKSYTIGANITF